MVLSCDSSTRSKLSNVFKDAGMIYQHIHLYIEELKLSLGLFEMDKGLK